MAVADDDLADLLQRAFRYALALSHDRAVAEDLVQDACVGLAKHGGPWEIGYLLASVRNRYIDRCRRERIVKFQPMTADDDFAGPSTAESHDDSLEAALGRLSGDERELLYLAAVEEHTSQQIATLTGRPLGTVLSSIHRAKQKLRQWLTPCESQTGRSQGRPV